MVDEVAQEETGLLRWLFELVSMLVLAFALAFAIKTWVVQPFIIPSGSMIPTLGINDRVLVNKFIYRFRAPQRGEIVVFADPYGKLPALIKRVVAVGGDTVDIRDDTLWINGKAMDEPYVHGKPTTLGTLAMPIRVPQGYVFLMGDNRPNSGDARYFGPQPIKNIQGEAFAIYWPLSGIKGL